MASQLTPPPIIYSPNDNPWNFYNPVKLSFGRGCRLEIIELLANKILLIVTTARGRQRFTDDLILGQLIDRNEIIWMDSVSQNPGLLALQAEIDRLKSTYFDAIIAFGGGSAIDSAKVINVSLALGADSCILENLLTNPENHRYANVKPLYSIPTTAGTGSEVTPFATVWNYETRKIFVVFTICMAT